jgi:hypothetical protein
MWMLSGCGLSDAWLVRDLTPEDLAVLCEEVSQEPWEITCTYDAVSVTIPAGLSHADCMETYDPVWFSSCDVTVGDVRACQAAWSMLSDEEFCDLNQGLPDACAPMIDCVFPP